MNESKKKLAAKGILAGFLNKVVTMVLPFVLRTVMIYTIGSEYLGLNSVYSSILTILSFAELGFGNVMVYSMYRPIAEGNKEKLCALLNLYKKLYRIIGTIILLIGLAIAPFLRHFIHGSYPSDVNLYVLYGVYLFDAVIGYWLFAYKSSLLSAHQLYYIDSNVGTVLASIKFSIQIILLLLFKNYYCYVVVLPIFAVLSNIATAIITKRRFPDITAKGEVDQETAREIRKNVLAGVGHRLGPTATTSVDNLVVSSYAGLIMASVYSNYNFIVTTVTGFISLVFGSFVAGIGNSLVTETREKNYEDFKFFTFMNSVLVGWSAICILCLSQPFMWLWVGERNGTEYMYPMAAVVLLAFMYYVQQIRAIVTAYKTAAGMWYADRLKPYVATIANAILDIVLFPTFGVVGIILSTIFARALIGIPWETNAMFKRYFKQPQIPYYKTLLKYLFITVLIGTVSYFACGLLPDGGLLWLAVKAVFCAVFTALLFVIFYCRNTYMRRILSEIGKLAGKLRKG